MRVSVKEIDLLGGDSSADVCVSDANEHVFVLCFRFVVPAFGSYTAVFCV